MKNEVCGNDVFKKPEDFNSLNWGDLKTEKGKLNFSFGKGSEGYPGGNGWHISILDSNYVMTTWPFPKILSNFIDEIYESGEQNKIDELKKLLKLEQIKLPLEEFSKKSMTLDFSKEEMLLGFLLETGVFIRCNEYNPRIFKLKDFTKTEVELIELSPKEGTLLFVPFKVFVSNFQFSSNGEFWVDILHHYSELMER